MATLVLTISETLRYRGKLGQWSWALHRIAGLGTLLFLFLHVIDTSWAVFYPDLYVDAIKQYQSPLFTVGEFGLVACVVYHALNGLRIVIFDWKPQWWNRQADAARLVFLGTIVILIPTFILMFGHFSAHQQGQPIDLFQNIDVIIATQARFALGVVVVVVVSLVVSLLYSVVPGANTAKSGRRSRLDSFLWLFMRVSGVLILPLVFGHLAMMHVIQGVFDITTSGLAPVGTTVANATGTAPEFVSIRWNTMFAGVFIWRLYDIGLLVLCVLHGFSGLRYVVNDYAHNIVVNRGLNIAILVTAIGLIIIGGLAIINTVPTSTFQMIQQSSQVAP
jgi:succinate dehydrogenase / fumarate reductase, cytochrome b subunit